MMIREYLTNFYHNHICHPKPKFKKGDIVELNNKGKEIIAPIEKTLVVSHVFWICGNYVVLFKNCHIHESICEVWLKLKE